MAKIRGIKPDLWTDENFTELSPFARLLWVGMWNFACDNGHLQDKSKQIKLRVLPTDEVNCAELLREIESQGLIERTDGWITIPNLPHHQKPHKRWFKTCDRPGCDKPEGSGWGASRDGVDLSTPKGKRSKPVRDGSSGDDAFGDSDTSGANLERKTTVAPPLNNGGTTVGQPFDVDGDGDGDGDGERNPLSDKSDDAGRTPASSDRFEEFWDAYDHKIAKAKARKAYTAALKKPGVTADLIITSAREFIAWKRSEGKHPEFTPHPTTWLHQERWGDERASRQPAHVPDMSPNMAAHMALVEQLRQEEADAQNVFPIDRQIGH